MLNQIRRAFGAVFFGAGAGAFAAAVALKVVSDRAHVGPLVVARYVVQWPIRRWQPDVQIAGIATIAVAVVAAAVIWRLMRNTRWSRGPRSLSSGESRTGLLALGVAKRSAHVFAGHYGEKPLLVGTEDRAIVFGPPGTGKTTFLVNQILQASEIGLSFAAVDLKPELYTILAEPLRAAGYRVLRVNPCRDDGAPSHWNPLDDLEDEGDISELCAALLPIRNANEAPFVDAQREWLKAALFHVKAQPGGGSLPAAYNFLAADPQADRLASVLARSTSPMAVGIARRINGGLSGHKQDPLIVPGLSSCLRSLEYLAMPAVQAAFGHSDFHVKDLGRGEKPVALFLQFEETQLEALGPLLAFAVTALLTGLIKTQRQRQPVALFLDELGNMPPIPGLMKKLNTLRQRQVPVWMYFQTTEQIEQQYGRNAINVFFAAADLKLVFRVNDQATRVMVSDLVGTTERRKVMQTSGSGDRGPSSTTSWETIRVIEPHALGSLPAGQVVCLYRGESALGYATPYYKQYKGIIKYT